MSGAAPGWFVRQREVVLLCLLAVSAILLAIKSGFSDHRAARAERRAEQAQRAWEVARDSLLARNWVPICETCKVVNMGPRSDSLPRAVR